MTIKKKHIEPRIRKERKVLVKTKLNKEVVLQVRVDKRFYEALKATKKNLKIKKNGDFLRGLLYLGLLHLRSKEIEAGGACSFK